MKRTSLMLYGMAVMMLVLLSGCMTDRRGPNEIVIVKVTNFGADISYDSASTSPHVRIGLVRYYYIRVPTSTNQLYAPDYATRSKAEIKPLSQNADEQFGFGAGVRWVDTNPPK